MAHFFDICHPFLIGVSGAPDTVHYFWAVYTHSPSHSVVHLIIVQCAYISEMSLLSNASAS